MTQAEDAFGFTVGRESIGIYNATFARGFSPTQAGNLRIDGLYFDPASGLIGSLVDSVSVRVGLSAQGYPFAAPSGIVDQRLRKPEARSGASLIANLDAWGSVGVELDGTLPVNSKIGIAYGAGATAAQYADATHARRHSESLVARWRIGSIDIIPFWSLFNDYDDESTTLYAPAGSYLPALPQLRHFEGPNWSGARQTATNHGLLASASLGKDWSLRLGAFRSVAAHKRSFSNLLTEELPDGTGERITIADPPATNRTLSGEVRLIHNVSEGPRNHLLAFSARARYATHEFGGSAVIDDGPGSIGQKVVIEKPEFLFTDAARDSVRQLAYGVAYSGQWQNVGQIGFGLWRSAYRKTTLLPDGTAAKSRSEPWLYNANAAAFITPRLVAYVSYARGLEENGIAPANASNRNQPLPVVLTEQEDAGFRYILGKDLKFVAAVFRLSRPYFGFEATNFFTKIGNVRNRGAEFSLSGQVTPKLSLVAGGVLLDGRVTKDADAAGAIGSKPVGIPTYDLTLNANWQTPLRDLELDAMIHQRGRIPATTDNKVFVPSRLQVDVGSHLRFKLAGKSASLRLQVANLFNAIGYGVAGSGLYWRLGGRYFNGYLAVDF